MKIRLSAIICLLFIFNSCSEYSRVQKGKDMDAKLDLANLLVQIFVFYLCFKLFFNYGYPTARAGRRRESFGGDGAVAKANIRSHTERVGASISCTHKYAAAAQGSGNEGCA